MNTKQKLSFYKSKVGQLGIKDWREVARAGHFWSISLARKNVVTGARANNKMWCEDTSAIGLRFVGFADKVTHFIKHTGWFSNSFQDSTYRGAVYQLPAKNGQERFIAGYVEFDGKQEVNEGSAYLDLDIADDKTTAAKLADYLAERCAEESREFCAKDQAEQQICAIDDDVDESRAEVKRLLAERRKLKKLGDNAIVCELFREKVCALLTHIKQAKERKADLQDNYWLAVEWGY